MEKVQLTFICPTRNRPLFVERLIFFASKVNNSNIKFIIVDNSSISNFETRDTFLRHSVENTEYVRAPRELSMVANWEWALQQTNDDYVGFLTDKMFPLPKQIDKIYNFLEQVGPDLLSWFDNTYFPDSFESVFGPGGYVQPQCEQKGVFEEFDPKGNLSQRLIAQTKRSNMSPMDYARGKICFGVYSKRLINQIVQNHQRLFFPISPDYTSLVLALENARNAFAANFAAIVHMNTDVSNGNNIARHDKQALQFLLESGVQNTDLDNLPIPGVYSSIHNLVLYDYLQMCQLLDRPVTESLSNWYERIEEDIMDINRVWSNETVMVSQKNLLLENELFASAKLLEGSQCPALFQPKLREKVFNSLPQRFQNLIQNYRPDSFGLRCTQIADVLSYDMVN
jgi:Glycosyl transferase family 2